MIDPSHPPAGLALLLSRRSIRVYAPGPIPDDAIRWMLEAAMAAPSAVGKDPWRFLVVRAPETLKRMAAVLPHGQMLTSAGAGIVVCGDLQEAHDQQLSYLLQDCAAATENLLLAAHALGLGACWLGIHPREERIRRIRELFELPQPIIPVAAVSLGYPGEQKEARTRYVERHVHHERW